MTNLISIITILIIVLFSLITHEVMHAFAGYWLGDDTAKINGRLSFNPLKHIDPFLTILLPLSLALIGAPIVGGAKPVPFNPNKLKFGEWGVLLVAIAGPLTNLLIAFLAFAISVMIGHPVTGSYTGFVDMLLGSTVVINLGFFIFNMIPIPPLDGSRVLYALAPNFIRQIMDLFEGPGIILVFVLMLFAGTAFNNFIYTAINWFVSIFAGLFGV